MESTIHNLLNHSRFVGGYRRTLFPDAAQCGGLEGAREMTKILRWLRRDDGMTTAEYAVGTIAAVALAGVLYKVVTSGAVFSALSRIVRSALSIHL